MGEDSPTVRKNGTGVGSTQEGTGGDGEVSRRWRESFSAALDQR
jgi:hypothetical protein